MEYSKNELAEQIVGLRKIDVGVMIFDQPCELGYHCPICNYEIETNGEFDERLEWSEYNGFIYCRKCNKDYPSCFCVPFSFPLPKYVAKEKPIDYAIGIYLRSVAEAKKLVGDI
jgi:hypothetical protein